MTHPTGSFRALYFNIKDIHFHETYVFLRGLYNIILVKLFNNSGQKVYSCDILRENYYSQKLHIIFESVSTKRSRI